MGGDSGEFGGFLTTVAPFPAKLVVAGGKLPFGHRTCEDGEVIIPGFLV